jgi:hypothetical protein
MNGDYGNGNQSEIDSKTTGRWSREEHDLFIEGKIFSRFMAENTYIAMSIYGKDWKKVEQHIGTRSGA